MSRDGKSVTGVSRRKYLTVAGAAGVVGLAGCSSSGGSGSSSTSSTSSGGSGTTGTTTGKNTGSATHYKVGVTTPLSGTYSFLGKGSLQGMKIAKAHLENDLNVKIDLVVEDTETKPSVSLQKMKKLVNKDRVDFTLGGVSSSDDIKMGNWASDNGVVYIASGSHSTATTGKKCAKYMFRTPPSAYMHAKADGKGMANYAPSWYIIYSNYTADTTYANALEKALKANGAKVVGKTAAPFPSKDFSPYINKAKSSGAAGVAPIVGNKSKFMKQFVNKGLEGKMKLAAGIMEEIDFWHEGKKQTENMGLMSAGWSNEVPQTALGKKVINDVVKRFNASPFVRHWMGYTSLNQEVRAAERAGSVKAPDMRNALAGWEMKKKMKKGKMYWRKADNQLVQPTYTLKPKPISKMQDKPYKAWWQYINTFKGKDTVRKVDKNRCYLA